jgi:type III secretory pathway component EscU
LPFRYRGSRRESAVAQLFSLGHIAVMDQIQFLWTVVSAFFAFSLCRHAYHLGLMNSVGIAVGGYLVGFLLSLVHYRVTQAAGDAKHRGQVRPFYGFVSGSLGVVLVGMFLYVVAALVVFVHSIISR